MSGARSLSPEQNARVREALRRLWKKLHTQANVARELNVSQQTVSAILGGGVAGVSVAASTARALRVSYEDLVNGSPLGPQALNYAVLPGWEAAAEQARRERRVPPFSIRAVGTLAVGVKPEVITSEFVVRLALFWLEYVPLHERVAAEKAFGRSARAWAGGSSRAKRSARRKRGQRAA